MHQLIMLICFRSWNSTKNIVNPNCTFCSTPGWGWAKSVGFRTPAQNVLAGNSIFFEPTKIAQRKMWFWGFGIAPLSNVFAFHNYINNTIFVVNYNNTHVFYKNTVNIIKNWRMATFSPCAFSLSFHHQNVPIKLFCGLYWNAVQSYVES